MYVMQNSRHYNKIRGNFDLIREPMYKYRKEVKERLFRDNYLAFLWMFYRSFGDFLPPQNLQDVEIRMKIL